MKERGSAALETGADAPVFTLKDDEGKTKSLTDYRGRKLILYFYPRDETPGCTKEACSFRDSIGEIKSSGADILGVSRDSITSHAKFRSRHGLPFTLLSDPDGKVSKMYGVYKMRNMYGKSAMGIERSTFALDENGKIMKIFRKVKVDGHSNEVLEILRANASSHI